MGYGAGVCWVVVGTYRSAGTSGRCVLWRRQSPCPPFRQVRAAPCDAYNQTKGMAMAMVIAGGESCEVFGGVDTHLDVHVAAVLDRVGGVLDVGEFGTDRPGLVALADWLEGFGVVGMVGVEGTGSYGAGLAVLLRGRGIDVVEVCRPNRQRRRQRGKSDPEDAISAGRVALSGEGAVPKSRDGNIEAIRVLLVAKRSANLARTAALTQMRHLVIGAPAFLRDPMSDMSIKDLVGRSAGLRPDTTSDPIVAAAKQALRSLARRVISLDEELDRLNGLVGPLVEQAAPALLARLGVGPDVAARLLVAAGDNPQRLHSEAAWARLCGVAPLEASSGKVQRHRLNRGGNRDANSALWRIVMVRMSCDPRTRAYVERRTKQGRSNREIIRCLKRYVARELYTYLPAMTTT